MERLWRTHAHDERVQLCRIGVGLVRRTFRLEHVAHGRWELREFDAALRAVDVGRMGKVFASEAAAKAYVTARFRLIEGTVAQRPAAGC